MGVSELVRAELKRHDWASLACICGDTADHVPVMFEAILTAEAPREMIGYTLDGHVEADTNITECTAPAVGVIVAALAGELSSMARREFLQTLARVAAGSGCSEEPGGWPLGEACRAAAEEGFWSLVQIGLAGSADDADTVADICEYFNLGGAKSTYYRALLHERVRAKTKRRM